LKKIAAILLLLLFVFNLFGYKLLFYLLQNQSQQQMQSLLDKRQYTDDELVTIKVPLSIPYFTNWAEFEEYNGSIEVNGQHYNYVKRKVFNDTLILLCLPNEGQNQLAKAKDDFEKSIAFAQAPATGNKNSSAILVLKAMLGTFNQHADAYQLKLPGVATALHLVFNNNNIYNPTLTCPWQPPEIV
jgi:hypothetical protein